jgi:transcriptional regulator with XRE-family HTH domain
MGLIDFVTEQIKLHGYTLAELGKKVDIDPAYLSRIFNKHIDPSSKIIDKLLAAVNIDCDSIMDKKAEAIDLIGEIQDYDGFLVENDPKKINLFPPGSAFAVTFNAPPLIKGINFPSGYILVFSKDEKPKEGDPALVVYKEKGKTKKIIRMISFKKNEVILTTILPNRPHISIPKKDIVNMHKVFSLTRTF